MAIMLISLELNDEARVQFALSKEDWDGSRAMLAECKPAVFRSIKAALGKIPKMNDKAVVDAFVADLVLLAAASTIKGDYIMRGTVLKGFEIEEDPAKVQEFHQLAHAYGAGTVTRH